MARKLERTLASGTALAVGVSLLALSSAVPASAQEFVMKMATSTRNEAQHFWALEVEKAIEAATDGRIDVQVFPGGELGSPAAHIEGLQTGTVEGYMGPIDFFAGLDARGGVFSIPFLFKGRDHANRVFYQHPEVVEQTLDLFEDNGIIGCEFVSLNDGLYIAKDPIRTVADFDGKKLRVNATDAERERFRRLGASAVPMGLGDMVSSIQSGVIDGTMSGISIHVNFNLDDYSKTLLEVGDTLLITFGGISKVWLDRLPEDLQEQVLTACRDQDEFLVGAAFKDNVLLRKEWLERGGEIIHFSDEEFQKFHDTIASVGEEVTKGDPELKEFYEFVKAASDSTN